MMPVQREKLAFSHIPKTGGLALESYLMRVYPEHPTWFFSFFGLDSSKGANRVVVESMQPGDDSHHRVASNPHFQSATMVAGHFSTNLETFFPEYSFRYFTILREPVSRVISNIFQYSAVLADEGQTKFGKHRLPCKISSVGAYWSAIGEILQESRGGPIDGLMPHESMMFINGMCRMLSGAPLHTFTPDVSLQAALERAATMEIAWFSDFNATVTSMLAALGVPLVLDATTNYRGEGSPPDRMTHSPDYGCPDDVRALIARMNQSDLELYRILASR